MIGGWLINAVIRFSRAGTNTFASIGSDVARLDRMVDGHTSRIQRMTAALEAHRRKMLQLGATATGTMAAAGAGIAAYGIYGAAELQRSLTAVQISTNANSPKAMQRYAGLAFKVSSQTAQNADTIADEMAIAASSGLNDPKKLGDAFTRIAKAADVLWMSPKHTDPREAVRVMSQLSHLFGVYSGAPLQHMLDRAVQMQFVQPEGINQLLTQGRLFIPSARAAGVSEEDIFKQAMTMGQTGYLRSRGGSGLARMIEYLSGASTITGSLSKKQGRAMHDLGLMGANGILRPEYLDHGKLQLQKVVDHLEAIRNNFTPTAFVGELQRAFLAQGGRYAATILIPSVYQKSRENWQMMNKIGTVDTLWKKYSDNFLYQFSVTGTNLQNIAKSMFFPTLGAMTGVLKVAGQWLGVIVKDFADHPGVAAAFGYGLLALTGALATASATMGGILAWQAIQMPAAVLRMTTALDALTATISTDATAIDTETGVAGGALARVGGALRALAGAGAAFLASPLGMMFSAGAVLLGTTSFNPNKASLAGMYGKAYAKYIQSRHGKNANTFSPDDGDLTPDQFYGRQLLRKSGIKPTGYHGGGGFGPSVSKPAAHTTVHVGQVVFPNVRDRHEIAAAFDAMGNPLSEIYTGSPGSRTHPTIPRQITLSVS